MKPVERFTSQKELDSCLKWWQRKLGLENWVISATCVKQKKLDPGSEGENLLSFDNRESIIRLMRYEDYSKKSKFRVCQEKVLVHELLHCIYCPIMPDKTYEAKFLSIMSHQQLEQMAKTLIMVKYNLSLSYFDCSKKGKK